MKLFIEATVPLGKVYIRTDQILDVCPLSKDDWIAYDSKTVIHMLGDEEPWYVQDTPEEIMEQIMETDNG